MIRIACLPIAGIENPYQYLMMNGLNEQCDLVTFHGAPGKIFAFLKTAILLKPNYIHIDWLQQYYLRRSFWMTWIQFPFFVLEILIVKFIFKVKFVWTLHNIKPHDRPYWGPFKWARMFFAHQVSWIRVFSSKTAIKASKELQVSITKFKIIPEGSYTGYYPNEISRFDSRIALGLREDAFVLLFFGSIRPYKGIEDLINTFRELEEKEWTLIVAGMCNSDNYKNALKDLIRDKNIHFIPKMIEVKDVQIYMNAADVIILPFREIENSGSVILAMSFKKPIIAPAQGVLPKRLEAQPELLYKNDLSDILSQIHTFTEVDLQRMGFENYANLSKYTWNDFATCYRLEI